MKLLSLLLIIFITGCSYYIPLLEFTYCYDGEDRGIDTIVNIDGYFKNSDITVGSVFPEYEGVTTLAYSFFLYKDGTFLINNCGDFLTQKQFEEFLTKYKERNCLLCGRYIIVGDTIKAQYIFRRSYYTNVVSENWYKTQDKNTLIHIKSFCGRQDYPVSSIPLKFVPFPSRPDSTCWLKNKWWFKCKKYKPRNS